MIPSVNLNDVRQTLEAERVAVLDQIRQHEAQLSARIGSMPDHLDLAQESISRVRRAALLARAHQQLECIQTALHRLDTGCYGLCEMCGERIPPARLEVLPYACLCVRCQARQERSPRPVMRHT